VAAGLAYLHEKDIVHQDIKPDNILIDTEGNYLITDFGISTRARSTLRKSVMSTTNSAGTLAYMGPERFSTQPAPTKASDIWSLGAMLYELLEGVTPFPPDFGGSMLNAGAVIPAINAPVSENLKQTIYKMLSKETWDRPTAATLVQWASNPKTNLTNKNIKTTIEINQAVSNANNSNKPIYLIDIIIWILVVIGVLLAIYATIIDN
jgi:serine/threonine protein kinase